MAISSDSPVLSATEERIKIARDLRQRKEAQEAMARKAKAKRQVDRKSQVYIESINHKESNVNPNSNSGLRLPRKTSSMLTFSGLKDRRNSVKTKKKNQDYSNWTEGPDNRSSSSDSSSIRSREHEGQVPSERYNTIQNKSEKTNIQNYPQQHSAPPTRRASFIATSSQPSSSTPSSRRMSSLGIPNTSFMSTTRYSKSFSKSYSSLANPQDTSPHRGGIYDRPLSMHSMNSSAYNTISQSPNIDKHIASGTRSADDSLQRMKPQSYLSKKLSLLVGH